MYQWPYIQPDYDLQDISTPWTFRYYPQADWTGVILTENMEHVIKPPIKGWIAVWTDNNLKHIDPREPYQIQTLSRILDHIMDMKQTTAKATGLEPMIASAPIYQTQKRQTINIYTKIKHV